MTGSTRAVLLAAFSIAAMLVGAELMITAVALPAIVNDIAGWTELRRASWIVNGYLVAYIAAMPLAGRAADRYGLPHLLIGGLLIFAAGSLLAGAAQSLDWLIVARVLQGFGGGTVVPLATAGAGLLYAGHGRSRALGWVGAATFLGMALGPFVGAFVLTGFELGPVFTSSGQASSTVADYLVPAWRWVFYLGAPLACAVAIIVWAAAPTWLTVHGRGRLDVLGAALFTAALAAGLLALTWLGTDAGPDGDGVLIAAAVAVVAGVAASLHFLRTSDPFLDLRAFRNRVFSSAILVSLLTGYALATAIVGAAVFVDRVRYGGPAEQQVALGALAAAMALGALASGFGVRRLGVVVISVVGLLVGAAGLAVLAMATPATPLTTYAGGLACFGLGFGLSVTPRSTAALEALGRTAYGTAAAAVTVARMLGMGVGLAILTGFGSNRIEALAVVLIDQVARDAVLPLALRGRPLQDPFVVDALEAWAAGEAAQILASLMAVAAVVMIVAIGPALGMRRAKPTPAPTASTTIGPDERAAAGDDEPALAL
jgi:MFS family permease